MTKLVKLLQTLDKKEVLSFSRYLNSPFFCQHQEVITLFDFLALQHPDYPAFSLEEVNDHFPDWKLSRSRFNVLKNYLVNHFYGFLVQKELQEQPVHYQSLLVDGLLKRNRFKEVEKQLQVAKQHLPPNGKLDSKHYYHQISLAEQKVHLGLSLEMRSAETSLQDLFDHLDQFDLGWGLKYLLPAWTLHRLYGKPFPERRWRNYRSQLESSPEKYSGLTRMYYHLLCLLREEREKIHRDSIWQLLEVHADQMDKIELMNVYGYLQNHFTHLLLKGDHNAYQELFTVFQELDRHNLIFGRGNPTMHLIRNITVTSCRLNKMDWIRNFLQTHQTEIEEELGVHALSFSMAYLEFSCDNYQSALGHLQQVEFIDPFYRTGHQMLLLRIYYELNEFISLETLSATFRRYLNRSPLLSSTQKNLLRNFISVIRQLAKGKESGLDPRLKAKIRQMLDEFTSVTDRIWLEQKFNELIEVLDFRENS